MKQRLLLLFATVLLISWNSKIHAQCADTLVNNGGFEAGFANDWWSWHGGAPDAYAFTLSDDAFAGDSSAVISILVPADSITGGAAEYNSRPQDIPVTGGEFYEISLAAKSTVAGASIRINVKDENDNWVTIHSETLAIDTTWGVVTSTFQADVDRADVHLELTVFNADIQEPYQVFMDEICVAGVVVTTNTCADNLIANPGFESGANTDWWNWHGNNPDSYEFKTSAEAFIGDSSAMIRVLDASANITGPGEFNSRPQVSALVDSQNYEVKFYAKSTVENTEVAIWIKDEFDGWTTIHTETFIIGTDWTEAKTVFTADADREDVHVELKVFNEGFDPYDVWFDEVSICTTTEEPGGSGEPTGPLLTFGTDTDFTSCSNNLAPGNNGFEDPADTTNWDIWDGSDDEELSSLFIDPVLPAAGLNSVRMDISEGHDVAEFHHRFGPRFNVEDGQEYTFTMWLRSDVPAGDTVQILARVIRDTDWTAQATANFIITENTWLNYAHTFTGDGSWNNAFLEMKAFRWTDYSEAYSVWFDEIAICSADSASVTTGLEDIEELGIDVTLYPNPAATGYPAYLQIDSPRFLSDVQLTIMDPMGRTLEETTFDIQAGIRRMDLPTSRLTMGIYLVQIAHQGYVKNYKLQIVNP